jgi:hypothetical protein
MSGMHNERPVEKLPDPPLDFTQGKLVYTSQLRRCNRRYGLAAALSFLAVATGVVVVLIANWLATMMSR